jgi:prepilin-type N-terminal cleavage/methylation domain-containing protein/prepilin-type processing-associated H-X9-DG protein
VRTVFGEILVAKNKQVGGMWRENFTKGDVGRSVGNRSRYSEGMTHRFGFTLVELLVVIAIIALLLSVLMPSLQKARTQAQRIACSAKMRSWGLATVLYSTDYKGQFPWYASESTGNPLTDPVETVYINTLMPYLGGRTVAAGSDPYSGASGENSASKVRKCPAGKADSGTRMGASGWIGPHFALRSRTTAGNYSGPFVYWKPNQGGITENEPVRAEKVRSAATWVTFLDCYDWGFYSPSEYAFTHDKDVPKDGLKDTNYTILITEGKRWNWALPKIHGGGCNAAIFDGHVEYLKYRDFETREWSDKR